MSQHNSWEWDLEGKFLGANQNEGRTRGMRKFSDEDENLSLALGL